MIDPGGLCLLLDEGVNGKLNVIDTRTNRVVRIVEGLSKGGLATAILTR